MDLYRHAYEAAAFVGSDLVADCFEFALAARELDMRASPYDLSQWGLSPLAMETGNGRRQYAALQTHLAERAAPLRERLMVALTPILESATAHAVKPAQSAEPAQGVAGGW